MSAVRLSVVVCTFNPRRDYLAAVLSALRAQTLPAEDWELVVVDNDSSPPLVAKDLAGGPPGTRLLREPRPGKTEALIRAFGETSGALVVIVDDDNVLAPDYLERALAIQSQWPVLGTWGGSIVARFETPPPAWLEGYLTYLSVRPVARDSWFNGSDPGFYGHMPYGAGLCVRRAVFGEYLRQIESSTLRRGLDRRGTSLASSGDTDLVLCGMDLGLGTGVFPALRLEHLIPAARLTEDYMARMLRAMNHSLVLLAGLRGHPPAADSRLRRAWSLLRAAGRGRREWRFLREAMRGVDEARAVLRRHSG